MMFEETIQVLWTISVLRRRMGFGMLNSEVILRQLSLRISHH